MTAARGALVTVTATGGRTSLPFQYNPETLRRGYTPNTVGGTPGLRSGNVRYAAAATETLDVECQFSAVDAIGGTGPAAAYGVAPQLDALTLLASPTTATVRAAERLLATGTIEIAPAVADLLLFVWADRLLPVRLVSVTVTEQFFDSGLWPVRATVALSMRALTWSDVGPESPAYQQYLVNQQGRESLAALATGGTP
jgi:hypothetical protein